TRKTHTITKIVTNVLAANVINYTIEKEYAVQYSPAFNMTVYDLPADRIVQLCALIPESRRINGESLAIPLTLRNSQILRHLGLPALSPIVVSGKYDFPTKYAGPRRHQLIASAFKTLYPRNLDISDMRCGKSLSSLWAIDWLMLQGIIHKCLIISPLSTLERVWAAEIETNFYGRRTAS